MDSPTEEKPYVVHIEPPITSAYDRESEPPSPAIESSIEEEPYVVHIEPPTTSAYDKESEPSSPAMQSPLEEEPYVIHIGPPITSASGEQSEPPSPAMEEEPCVVHIGPPITSVSEEQPEPPCPAYDLPLEEEPYVVHIEPPITYQLFDKGTKRRKPKLMDSLGFTYNIGGKRCNATYWQCTVRPAGHACKATVVERDGVFTAGKSAHDHQAGAGVLAASPTPVAVGEDAPLAPATESALEEPVLERVRTHPAPVVTYELGGVRTKRGKPKLVDNLGFTYSIQRRRANCTYWQCTVRPAGRNCRASVIQTNGAFKAGKSAHNHRVETGARSAVPVFTAMKEEPLSSPTIGCTLYIGEPIVENVDAQLESITYEVLDAGTNRGRPKLVDSLGFTYTIQRERPHCRSWQCTVRPIGRACRASVIQRNSVFTAGKSAHNHPVGAGTLGRTLASVAVKAARPTALEEPAVEGTGAQSGPITYKQVDVGTKRGRPKLVDSRGFTYTIRGKGSSATYWQCTVRPVRSLGRACKASVIERDGGFIAGKSAHNHPVGAGTLAAAPISVVVEENVLSSPTESTLEEPDVRDATPQLEPMTYELVGEGTKRSRPKLVDSLGFTYNIQRKRPSGTYWQCTVRPAGRACRASVIQRNGAFAAGKSSHNHQVEAGALATARILAAVKAKALEEKSTPASAIVKKVLLDNLKDDAASAFLIKPEHMVRAANRLRQGRRSHAARIREREAQNPKKDELHDSGQGARCSQDVIAPATENT